MSRIMDQLLESIEMAEEDPRQVEEAMEALVEELEVGSREDFRAFVAEWRSAVPRR